MHDGWTHVGRLWTNGEPYLAVDSAVRHLWQGFSENEFFERIVGSGPDETVVAIGEHAAAVVGADGEVGDEGWLEVYESPAGTIAIVQASGDDYRHTLAAALRHPAGSDEVPALIQVGSGELAIFSAAVDGAGEFAMTLQPATPGHAPTEPGAPSRGADSGLLVTARATAYRVTARYCTELDESSCFARWLLAPEHPCT